LNTVFRKTAIKKIIPNLESLNASEFEHVCHKLVCIIENQQLIHRGLNTEGKPVGYTVDTFNSHRDIVAEYGTESGYFDEPFSKISSDTKHACTHASDLSKIYLFSNQKCPNSKWEEVVRKVKDTIRNELGPERAEKIIKEIYDSERIANEVYEIILKRSALYEQFSEFIPSLEIIWQDFQFAYNIPPLPHDYVSSLKHESALQSLIETDDIVIISGISGIGKSYIAINYVNRNKTRYDNIVWLYGDDIPESGSFTSLSAKRLGISFNLSNKFNSTKSLLIIDSWEKNLSLVDFQEFQKGFSIGGKIIVTSQKTPSSDFKTLVLKNTEHDIANSILTFGMQTQDVDENAVETIIKNSGGHPLLMALIRGVIQDGDAEWSELSSDASVWLQIEDNREKTILDRLLSEHNKNIKTELDILSWLKIKDIDSALAKHMFGIAGLRKLKRRSLLQDQSHGMLKLHDLTFLCVQSLNKDEDGKIIDKFLKFFEERIEIADFHFQRSLHICKSKIKCLANSVPTQPDLIHYLYFLLEINEIDTEVLNKIAESNLADHINSKISINAIIEAREKILFKSRSQGSDENQYDQTTISEINSILETTNLDDNVAHILLHHQGKCYRRVSNHKMSVVAFEAALKYDSNANHTRLQIARFYQRENPAKSAYHLDRIIKNYINDPKSVATTVLLASIIEIFRLRDGYGTFLKKIDNLKKLIIEIVGQAQAEGFSQPYEVVASLGRNIYYTDPEFVLDLYNSTNIHDIDISDKNVKHFDVAECIKNVGKASAQINHPRFNPSELYKLAMKYYSKVNTDNHFRLTMMAEGALLAQQPEISIKHLKKIPMEKWNCHIHHRMAQALEAKGDLDNALFEIEKSISTCKDQKYLSAFYDRKAEILNKLGDNTRALKNWKKAVDYCDHDKFKNEILKKIEGKNVEQINSLDPRARPFS